MRRRFAIFVLGLLLLAGCVISPRRPIPGSGGGGGGGGSTGGQLYVSTANSILHFANAETATGNLAPTGTISGSSTGLSSPKRLLVDTSANRLYVANQGGSSILVFDNVSTLAGNIAPTRVISGNATTLSAPVDIALDTTNDLLYVADGNSILVFASASTVNGNTAPAHSINMGIAVAGLLSDGANNQLYLTDSGDNAVDRLDSANAQNVVGIVGGAIAGADTKLSSPSGLALDGSNRLYVSNATAPVSITVYPNASIATGDSLTTFTISGGNTNLQSPQQIVLNRNVGTGELYVADPVAASILIFTNVATSNGNVSPARTISGANTGLAANAVNGIALDNTR